MTSLSNVWHHQPPEKVGSEVTDLTGQPGMMGWLTFIRSKAIAQQVNGRWVVQEEKLRARVRELADDIERAGFLMLDLEPPLGDPRATAVYLEALAIVNDELATMGLEDTDVGYYRIPDHKESQRWAQQRVIPLSSATFSMFKSPREDRTGGYLRDIITVAAHHAHVAYLDGCNFRTGEVYSEQRIIDIVRMVHGGLVNPQIVFRGNGPNAARGMKIAAAWLGY